MTRRSSSLVTLLVSLLHRATTSVDRDRARRLRVAPNTALGCVHRRTGAHPRRSARAPRRVDHELTE
jgi:hypothetical protein